MYECPTTLRPHRSGDTWKGLSVIIEVNGIALDLTDASVVMQMRSNDASGQVFAEWRTSEETITVTDAAAGQLFIQPRVLTGPGHYVFDIEVTTSDGNIRTPVSGLLTIEQDVSRG